MRKLLAIVIILMSFPVMVFAIEPMSDKELENITGASIIEAPTLAQGVGGDAGMAIAPFAMAQRIAEDVQTLTRPGSFANDKAQDTQTLLSPATTTTTVAAGFSF